MTISKFNDSLILRNHCPVHERAANGRFVDQYAEDVTTIRTPAPYWATAKVKVACSNVTTLISLLATSAHNEPDGQWAAGSGRDVYALTRYFVRLGGISPDINLTPSRHLLLEDFKRKDKSWQASRTRNKWQRTLLEAG
ncbi:hypothetical protein J6590_063540 [Homalodisca vitripennis]|nr:hypothetical protein J6590_063540 [Homalodisca vitripennis]